MIGLEFVVARFFDIVDDGPRGPAPQRRVIAIDCPVNVQRLDCGA
jgi:hypothetical protein